jgi:hypothetical protein
MALGNGENGWPSILSDIERYWALLVTKDLIIILRAQK